jgi:hypothetical protein
LAQKLLFASTFVGAAACTQAVVQGHAPFLCHNACSNFCLNLTEMFLFHLLQLLHHLLWLSSATLIHLQIQLITPLPAITEINVFPCCILSSQQCVGYVKLCWLDAFDWKFPTGTNQCVAVNSIFEEPSVSVFLIFQNRRIANPVIWVKKSESSNHQFWFFQKPQRISGFHRELSGFCRRLFDLFLNTFENRGYTSESIL